MSASQEMFHALRVGFAVFRRDDGIAQLASHDFRGGPSEGDLSLAIPGRDGAIGVHADECVVSRLEDQAVVLTLLPQRLLDVLQIRDVPGDAGNPGNPPALVEHRDLCRRHPADVSIGLDEFLDPVGLRLAGPHDLLLVVVPTSGAFGFEIVRIAFPHALRGVYRAESARLLLVDYGEAGIAVLEINQVRNVFHESAQQLPLAVHFPDQFEVNYGGADRGLQFERFPRLADIGEDLSAIDCVGKGMHVGISGDHDAGRRGHFLHPP